MANLSPLRYMILALHTHSLDYLPSTLRELYLSNIGLSPLSISLDHLPSSFLLLHLDGYNVHVDHLPSSLKNLRLGRCFNVPVDNLPCSLSYLHLGCTALFGTFKHCLDHLPHSLPTSRLYSHSYGHSLNYLPPFIKELTIMVDLFTVQHS